MGSLYRKKLKYGVNYACYYSKNRNRSNTACKPNPYFEIAFNSKIAAIPSQLGAFTYTWAAVAQLAEYSDPDRRTCFRGSPSETPPCTLKASDTCKIHHGCNILHVLIQIIPLGYQSGKAIPSVTDENSDGMSPDHP